MLTPRPSKTALALSIVVNVEEGAEISLLDGDGKAEPVDEMNLVTKGAVRNPGNESNYQYGIKEGFKRVADLLTKYDIPATWTCAAVALERAPQIADFIKSRGDEAASHGYRWIHQFKMTPEEEREFIVSARESIERSIGIAPVGHLSRYLFTEETRSILKSEGFLYSMDDYSGDWPFWEETSSGPIVVVPYAIDTNDMKMWADPGYTPTNWLKYNIDTFDRLYEERLVQPRMMSVGLHLRIVGRPGRIGAFEEFLKHVKRHEDVWITYRKEIAQEFSRS